MGLLIVRGIVAIGSLFGVTLALKETKEVVKETTSGVEKLIIPATIVAAVFLVKAVRR